MQGRWHMSASKHSQNDKWDDQFLTHLILSDLRNKKTDSLLRTKPCVHEHQSLLKSTVSKLQKYIYKHLLSQSASWFLRTGNRIQSKTL